MENATHNRISRLLPLLILVGLAFTASTVSAGVNAWTTNGPEGGDIRALAIDPVNAATLYAGTSGGGVFKSTNGGGGWRAVNTGLTGVFQAGTGVTALAIDPSTPATLYARRSGFSIHAGVFKSTNGGDSWSPINPGLISTSVLALAIDPSAPAILYAGTRNGGVYRSANGGGSWSFMSLNPAWDEGPDVTALAIGSSALYAGTSGGVFKNTNGGDSWTAINTGLTGTVVLIQCVLDARESVECLPASREMTACVMARHHK